MDAWPALLLSVLVVVTGCAAGPTSGPDATPTTATVVANDTGTATTEGAAGSGTTTATSSNATTTASTSTTTGESSDSTSERASSGMTVDVEAVATADTLIVRYPNGSLDRVRVVGVDAPPVHRRADPTAFAGVPDNEEGEECLRSVGTEAESWLSSRLVGERVTLAPHAAGPAWDANGRLRTTVEHEGFRLDRLLALQGFVRVTDRDAGDSIARNHQASARAAGAGVWACSEVEWQFGDDTTLSVTEVHANAAGSAPDRRHLVDEYVVITNTGERAVDLTGWDVIDGEGTIDYTFPDGFVLNPDENVTLHSGAGFDTDRHLYWGLGEPIWENDGGVVFLRRPDGSVALRNEYGNRTEL